MYYRKRLALRNNRACRFETVNEERFFSKSFLLFSVLPFSLSSVKMLLSSPNHVRNSVRLTAHLPARRSTTNSAYALRRRRIARASTPSPSTIRETCAGSGTTAAQPLMLAEYACSTPGSNAYASVSCAVASPVVFTQPAISPIGHVIDDAYGSASRKFSQTSNFVPALFCVTLWSLSVPAGIRYVHRIDHDAFRIEGFADGARRVGRDAVERLSLTGELDRRLNLKVADASSGAIDIEREALHARFVRHCAAARAAIRHAPTIRSARRLRLESAPKHFCRRASRGVPDSRSGRTASWPRSRW